MAKSSKEYWAERERENLEKNLKTEAEYFKEIEDIYKYTMNQIQKEIDSFYAKYASKEGITIAEAKKRASKLDMEEFSRKAKKYVEEKNFSQQANDEMRLYNLTMKVNRLELLKAQIGLELVSGFDELQQFFDEKLTERTLEEFQRQAGLLGLTILDNVKMAEAIVNASFKNATFSERIWTHQDLLRAELEKLLRTGLIQGRNPRELAQQIRKVFDTSVFNSERLLRTELARVQTEAQKQSYIRNGFDQYTYITCGDFKVCGECKPQDGKHYDVEKMMPGDNAPPMHPCCRCSTAAYMDDESYDEWNNGYKDHGLSYADWKKRYKGKSVELPRELIQSGKVPADIKQMISETIDEISKVYGVDMSDIEFTPYYDNPKAPFTFIPYSKSGEYHAKLNINELFDWNESVEAFNDRVYNKNYKRGILASQRAEDLLYHEAAHFITFSDCKTYDDYVRKEAEVRRKFIGGVSGYADATMDGAETIAEAFVRRKNGETLIDDIMDLLKEYIGG